LKSDFLYLNDSQANMQKSAGTATFHIMKIWALSDPHLFFSNPDKNMTRFGDVWANHPAKIKQHWYRCVRKEDVILIPGDISWAKKFEGALADLNWLHNLPGTKIILRGNHDYWWPKSRKLQNRLPDTFRLIQNNSVQIGNCLFFGTRLWETAEYNCNDIIDWDPAKGPVNANISEKELCRQEKIYRRELERLRLSINSLPRDNTSLRIGLCHFPPLPSRPRPTRASALFQEAGASHVAFGHLHSVKPTAAQFGELDGIRYHLASGDYLGFRPLLICDSGS
jgi:predicted phosphohydrolase